MMKRNISGIFLLDKPIGVSSNHILQRVKRLFSAAKAGHTGSLDPLATGMLPICFGEATKYSHYLLEADKVYEVTATLGMRTDTGDSEGNVIHQSVVEPELTEAALADVLRQFRGQIQQIPPMYSALKHQGKPLYDYARKGQVIERAARTVTIYALQLLSYQGDGFSLRVHCSKGTYIRSLIDDIGQVLGCGAHVTALRRLWVAPFENQPMLTIDCLEHETERDRFLLPLDSALMAFPKQVLNDSEAKRLLCGLPLSLFDSDILGVARFYNELDQFLGVGKILVTKEVVDKRLISCLFK